MEKKKILVIDDEEDLCNLLKMNLESTDEFEVAVAYSGREGLEQVKQNNFDLVITDFNMPEMNGAEIMDAIKEMKPLLPVVLFSIYHDDDSTLPQSVRGKARGIISKPIDHVQLRKTLKEILGDSKS